MKALSFDSEILKRSDRYPQGFSLPDYLYTLDGKLDRAAMLALLLKEEYGVVQADGATFSVSLQTEKKNDIAGKALHQTFLFTFERAGKTASFPMELFLPVGVETPPVIVQMDFEASVPNKYCSIEELMDMGVAVAHLCYREISTDNGDFENGLAALLCDRKNMDGAGKIAVWAYAGNTVVDWLLERGVAKAGIYVAGHSRLGKTALLMAVQNERIAGVLSNCSGCCGAAISRENHGETVRAITEVFPYWFTPAFGKYADKEGELPFDQHYLLALVAPRLLCVTAAKEDTWADTEAQYLCAEAASVAYERSGVVGLSRTYGEIGYGEADEAGEICFSKRFGTHWFSRDDWQFFIRNIKRRMKNV